MPSSTLLSIGYINYTTKRWKNQKSKEINSKEKK
jgi:hypothetical protein